MQGSRFLGVLFVAGAIGGCAVGEDESAQTRPFGLDADEATLAASVLDLVNTADAATLKTVVSTSAANAIVAARPLATLGHLASVSYVGDAALNALLARVAPDDVASGAGFWEETLLAADQAVAALDMANGLELTMLGCDLGLSATVAQRVIAARPLDSVKALVDVPYFGAAHLRKFKDNIGWYRTADATATRLDCVSFTPAEREAGLRFANEAGYGQLCSVAGCGFGGWTQQVGILLRGRDWTSLEEVAATRGIGPASMGAIRRGAHKVLAGMPLGWDSVRGVLAGHLGDRGWVMLAPTQVLERNVDVGSVYVPETGYRLSACSRIADVGDPDPYANSALHCTATCSPETRFWFRHDLGLIFFTGTHCSID
jgi:hypothetical protein